MQIHQVAPKTKKQKRQIYLRAENAAFYSGGASRGRKPGREENDTRDKRFDKEAAQKERLPIQVVPKDSYHRES